ncbi:BatA domain-containing protein [Rubellicoccus peritrichatus]|uniref:BatA domain-containing protein n=1 Tax=Rubellicoccus peritrichatus TaxID=3080537 RepID=A0AAQ3L620_9BACT|nr:BatA domain-containing protein [Puniceicoccus sp. CR14]WOO39716.1 BatA domain-containing protein [Puniceicoccus sp. CR14]
MQIILGNPAGLWGLLMIPTLVLIHCFQRRRKPQVISTLFLVEAGGQERRGGREFVFWKHSITFWMQILAALLLTWLLLQPRWIRDQSQQRIAMVLDSSLSMDAFMPSLIESLDEATQQLGRASEVTDWLLMESDETAPIIYHGMDRDELLLAAKNWQPSISHHDPDPALRRAQSLIRETGAVVFITDHADNDLPAGVGLLSVGESTENVGFTGVTVGMEASEPVWRTIIRNYGDQAATRKWWIEIDGQSNEARTVSLEPGGSLAIAGTFPYGKNAMDIILESDAWSIDDRMPVVWPEPKRLAYILDVSDENLANQFRSLTRSVPEVYQGTISGTTDLLVRGTENLIRQTLDIPFQVLYYSPADSLEDSSLLGGQIAVEEHPLMQGLNWNGLLASSSGLDYKLGPNEEPLLWAGERPLIWIRKTNTGSDLVVNFDLEKSNAFKLPAFVLLFHRFAELARTDKPVFQRLNLETGQDVSVTLPDAADVVTLNGEVVSASSVHFMEAPDRPAWLDIHVDDKPLLLAATHFADVREADLRQAESHNNLDLLSRDLIEAQSEDDFLFPFWVLLLTGVMLASWNYAERGR